jgi:uncharacterized protein (DUF362 family)
VTNRGEQTSTGASHTGKFTRRQLLRYGRQSGLALGASKLLSGCGTPEPSIPPDPSDVPTEADARVAVIRGADLAGMARDALNAFGGAGAFVKPGETVFIKPNFGAVGMVKYDPITKGDSVKPEIVIAVAEECLKAGASMVTIGEGGQVESWDWTTVATLDGTTHMAAEAERLRKTYGDKIRLACLNVDSPEWDRVPSRTALEEIEVSSLATRADRIISLPVIKTHRWTLTTGALKNLFGLTPVNRYATGLGTMRKALHDAGLHQVIVDIAKRLRPDFAIMDFSIGCEGNGPHVLPCWWGTSVDVRERLGNWMLLASPDPVALDATATRVISLNAEDVEHVVRAYDQGLGQMLENRIALTGATLDELRMPWTAPHLTQGFLEVVIPGIALLTSA